MSYVNIFLHITMFTDLRIMYMEEQKKKEHINFNYNRNDEDIKKVRYKLLYTRKLQYGTTKRILHMSDKPTFLFSRGLRLNW